VLAGKSREGDTSWKDFRKINVDTLLFVEFKSLGLLSKNSVHFALKHLK
jgi:hypothetical protein